MTPRLVTAVAACALLVSLASVPDMFAQTSLSFLTYLQSDSAAMVAFSPTNHDPRGGTLYRAPDAASLAADVASLRPAFDGLILYGFEPKVTPQLLAEMRRAKYRAVILGVWDPKSREEIEGVAALADQYSDTLAVAIRVGNEGIAFNRYTFEDVTGATDAIKNRMRRSNMVAFCTSEPFGQYGWAPLRGFGDFLAPNIHPVFDQPKLVAREAVAWVRDRAMSLAESASRPVLVQETGFPHGDRYTPALQQAFWSEYLRHSLLVRLGTPQRVWISFAAAFEAFDLPWKAEQSGIPLEDSWGLLDAQRRPYPAFVAWETRPRLSRGQ